MIHSPKFSVVVPVYNAIGHLQICLDAILSAIDSYGNENITEFYEIELEPVDDGGHTPEIETDTRPKWVGVVLLCGIAVAALVIVMTSRGKPKKEDEEPENLPENVEEEIEEEAEKKEEK